MQKLFSKQKGFTLIEMIVSLAIFAIVAVVAVTSLLRILDANRKSLTLKTAINNMNVVLETMSREIRVGRNFVCINPRPPSAANSSNSHNSFQTADGAIDNAKFGSMDCPTNSANTIAWLFAFYSTEKCTQAGYEDRYTIYAYRFVSNRIQKAQQDPNNCKTKFTDRSFHDVIDATNGIDIHISNSYAKLSKVNNPYAFFWFKGYSGVKQEERTTFTVQTSVSQRIE